MKNPLNMIILNFNKRDFTSFILNKEHFTSHMSKYYKFYIIYHCEVELSKTVKSFLK